MNTVLITGCSSGVGLELASAFARRGDTVLATMRDTRRGSALLERLDADESARVRLLELDTTDAPSVARLGATVAADFADLSVVVNNAGISVVGSLEAVDESALREVFETNFFGALAVTRALLPVLRQQSRGRIIFIGAIGALLSTPYLGAYCTSKHALDCMAATLDIELRPAGIRVSSIHPGPLRTDIAKKMVVHAGEGTMHEPATRAYAEGLRQRLTSSPDSLAAVTEVVFEAVDSDQPRPRYVMSSRMGPVLAPLVQELEALHDREYEMTAPLQKAAAS
jgi:NAD(P)-dependent dehydrogenase (short-subunit alcohol dehydrogenase family)